MSPLQDPVKVKFFTSSTGNNPVWNFVQDLPPEEQKYFDKAIARCETIPLPSLKSGGYLEKMSGYDIYELRVHVKKKEYRILCTLKGAVLWLLHAFQKKSQKIKQKEINTALDRFQELKSSNAYGL